MSYPTTYEEAVAFERKTLGRIQDYRDALQKAKDTWSEEMLPLLQAVVTLVPPGLYRHFKSEEKKYTILGVAEDVNHPGQFDVVYIAHYGSRRGMLARRVLAEEGVKGKDSFLRPIDREGYGKVVRFKFLTSLDPA